MSGKRHENKGLVGAARPPSLLAGASLKYFTLQSPAVNTANYAAAEPVLEVRASVDSSSAAERVAKLLRLTSGSSLGSELYLK